MLRNMMITNEGLLNREKASEHNVHRSGNTPTDATIIEN